MSELFLRPLFTWRSAIASHAGPSNPTTRHVLLTIALHMNEKGGSSFPSIDLLAEETGLARRTVVEHTRMAAKEGWLGKRELMLRNGQGWRRMEYIALIPAEAEASLAQKRDCKKGGDPGAPRQGGASDDKGGAANRLFADPTLSKVSTSISLKALAQPEGFALFWNSWPKGKKKSKGLAERWWTRVKPDGGQLALIMAGLTACKLSHDWTKEGGRFIPHPSSWLSAKGWLDEVEPAAAAPKQCTWSRCNARASRNYGTRPVCETHEAAYQRGETP